MISLEEAQSRVLALADPVPMEIIPLREAHGRVLAKPLRAMRDQPPFDASAMDGYAVRKTDVGPRAQFDVIGEAAAGHGFDQTVGTGQAVRIFTGAPMPAGTDRVVIQEDVSRTGSRITLNADLDTASYVRARGADFHSGMAFSAPRRLTSSDLALLAAMNIATVSVACQPRVAILATGDELVMPGEDPNADQIIASNIFGLKAQVETVGGIAQLLPIARDTEASLNAAFELADGADLLVSIGGASVGDHDLVGQVAGERGLDRAFYKIAMRPGKPLMAGRLGSLRLLGLPGNPVSALVCGEVFLKPMLRAMQGLPDPMPAFHTAPLAAPLSANGPRAHFMRAKITSGTLTAFERQDSALLTVLADANALLFRPVSDPARAAGETVNFLPLFTDS